MKDIKQYITNKKDLEKFGNLLCVPAYACGESFGDMICDIQTIATAFKKYLLSTDEDFYKQMVDYGYNNAAGYVRKGDDDQAFSEALKCAGVEDYYGDLDKKIMWSFVEFLFFDKKIKKQFVEDIQQAIDELIENDNIDEIFELFKSESDLKDTFKKFKNV